MADPRPLFAAVGHNGQRLVSTDGSSWTNVQVGKEGQVYRGVAFGNGRIVAGGTYGGRNLFASSKDAGATWEVTEKDGNYTKSVHGLGFGLGQFVAVGGRPEIVGVCEPFALTSPDGVAWSDYAAMNERLTILRRVVTGKAPDGKPLLVGVGDRGRRAASADGRAWVEVEKVKAIDTLVDLAYGEPGGKPLFVGVGLHGLRMTSTDGLQWSDRLQGEEGEHLNSIVWTGDRFVAVGMGATYVSPDGAAWDRKPNADAPVRVAYGNRVFVGANWRGRLLRSDDGVAWTQTHKVDENIEAVAFGTV